MSKRSPHYRVAKTDRVEPSRAGTLRFWCCCRGGFWLAGWILFGFLLQGSTPQSWGQATGQPAESQEGSATEEKLLKAAFEDLFEVVSEEKTNTWLGDFNGDGEEDLAVLARVQKSVPDAWRRFPLANPPYEAQTRGELEANPLRPPQYVLRKNEVILVLFHGRDPGWRKYGVSELFILQDIAGHVPRLVQGKTDSGEARDVFEVYYDGIEGVLSFDGLQYVVTPK